MPDPAPIHLSLLMGPQIPVPVPQPVTDALLSAQVTVTAGQRSGFQLGFDLAKVPGDPIATRRQNREATASLDEIRCCSAKPANGRQQHAHSRSVHLRFRSLRTHLLELEARSSRKFQVSKPFERIIHD